jgi:hypothetical protein
MAAMTPDETQQAVDETARLAFERIKPDQIQQAVNDSSDLVFTLNRDSRVGFYHFLVGPSRTPYRLRRSRVHVGDDTWLAKVGADKPAHEKVLKSYIRHLDREHTFLNLAVADFVRLLEVEPKVVTYVGTLTVVPPAEKNSQAFELYTPPDIVDGRAIKEWSISWEAAGLLAPAACIEHFFSWLYSSEQPREVWEELCDPFRRKEPSERTYTPDRDRELWERNFLLAKAELYGKEERGGLTKLADELDGTDDGDGQFSMWSKNRATARTLWDDLSSVQSALLYFRAATSETRAERSAPGDLSGSIIIRRRALRGDETAMVAVILSPAIAAQGERIEKLEATLVNGLNCILGKATSGFSMTENRIHECLTIDRKAGEKAQIDVRRHVYRSSLIGHLPTPHTDWALLLVEHLVGQRHEGEFQDFFLVCGDLSEFEDSNNATFRPISAETWGELDRMKWPSASDAVGIKACAASVAEHMANEHYPWFARGRYALLWNLASDEGWPVGLLEVKGSSWLQVVEDRFRPGLRTQLPSCLVCFVAGSPQTAGAVVIHDGKARELLRWRIGSWQLMLADSRRTKLLSRLGLIPGVLLEDDESRRLLKETVDIALRVADDPRRGGTIVFARQEPAPPFREMGKPLKPVDQEKSEDICALIAQDGATLRLMQPADWKHRMLIVPSRSAKVRLGLLQSKVKEILDRKAQEKKDAPDRPAHRRGEADEDAVEWPLEHRGSRRWSSAMASLEKGVLAVIVISQDGEIQLWHTVWEGAADATRDPTAQGGEGKPATKGARGGKTVKLTKGITTAVKLTLAGGIVKMFSNLPSEVAE